MTPTIALFLEEARYVARTIAAECVIVVDSEKLEGEGLIDAQWAEHKVRMFAQDIRARGERVD